MTPPRREQFALTGPSAVLDPRSDAVRPDLADVRLASRVFAPHYARPLTVRVARTAALRAGPEPGAERLADLEAGSPFEMLERAGGRAWGVAPGLRLVGYVDDAALAASAP